MSLNRPTMLLIAVLAGVGCHCGSAVSTPVDSALPNDIGDADAEADVADAREETSSTDAVNPDVHGGYGPFVGDWSGIPGLLACSALLAHEPAKSVPMLAWKKCASGRAGCQVVIVDWTVPSPSWRSTLSFSGQEPVQLLSGRPILGYGRSYYPSERTYPDYVIDVLQPLDGPPVAALGFDSTIGDAACAASLFAGERAVVISGEDIVHIPRTRFISWSSWTTPTDFTAAQIVPYADFGFGDAGGGTQYFAVSDTRFFIELLAPPSIAVFDPDTRTVVDPALSSRRPAEYPLPLHGGAIALDLETPYGIFFIGDDGTYSVLRTVSAPYVPSMIAVDRSGGPGSETIVWVESISVAAGYDGSVLWAAPYATTEASSKPRRVAALGDELHSGGASLISNAGMVLAIRSSTTATLVRLSDGVGWIVKSEPGTGFGNALWVDDTEIWLSTYDATSGPPGEESGMVRIRRDTLGPPTLGP